ncbi:hypothetical protein RCL1_000822 [Eukaryota sp. TZLM3-RCL]
MRKYLSTLPDVETTASGISHWKITDLRQRIQTIANHAILSSSWLSLASILHQLAVFAQSERIDSNSDNLSLWDSKQNVMRLLVEEAKSTIIIPLLSEYKSFISSACDQEDGLRNILRSNSKQSGLSPRHLADAMIQFEEGAGALLENLLHFEEVFQTINLPAFVHHLSSILSKDPIVVLDGQDPGRSQEALVVPYCLSLTKNLEKLDSNIITSILEEHIISKLLLHVSIHKDKFADSWYLMGLEALSLFFIFEDFEPEISTIITTDQEKQALVNAVNYLPNEDLSLKEINKFRGLKIAARKLKLL